MRPQPSAHLQREILARTILETDSDKGSEFRVIALEPIGVGITRVNRRRPMQPVAINSLRSSFRVERESCTADIRNKVVEGTRFPSRCPVASTRTNLAKRKEEKGKKGKRKRGKKNE